MNPVWFPFDEQAFIHLLTRLAQIPGPTFNEEGRKRELERFLVESEIPVTTDSAGNLMAVIQDGPFGDTLLFDAHLDVVGSGGCTPEITHRASRDKGWPTISAPSPSWPSWPGI